MTLVCRIKATREIVRTSVSFSASKDGGNQERLNFVGEKNVILPGKKE